MIYFAGKQIKAIYLGDKPVFGIYLGGRLIWQSRVYASAWVVIALQSDTALRAVPGVSYTVDTAGGMLVTESKITASQGEDMRDAVLWTAAVKAAPYMRHIAWSIAHGMLGSLSYAAPDQAGGSENSALGNGVQAQAAQLLCADGKNSGSGSVLPQVEAASGISAEAGRRGGSGSATGETTASGISAGAIRRGGSGSATAEAAVDTTQANSADTGTEKAVVVAQYRNNARNASATSWDLTAQAQIPVPVVRPHIGDCQAIQTANPVFFGSSRVKSADAVPLKESASCAAGEAADVTGIALPGLPTHAATVLPMGAACTPRTILELLNALDLLSLQTLDALPLDEWDALLVCT